MTAHTTAAAPPTKRSTRRDEILKIAVNLFASRGFHGVSMDDIGAAAGVTGPALYHHFKGKDALLIATLVPVSEQLLRGAQDRAGQDRAGIDPARALEALVTYHVDFALDNPAVIALQAHELDRLPAAALREVRGLQRQYVEVWVQVLTQLRGDLGTDQLRALAHAGFGLMNSTPFLRDDLPRTQRAQLLSTAALAALTQGSAR